VDRAYSNPTNRDIELTGWLIFSGGSQYSLDYVFPYYVLRAGRFVVVGGDEVPQAHFNYNFRFQTWRAMQTDVRYADIIQLSIQACMIAH